MKNNKCLQVELLNLYNMTAHSYRGNNAAKNIHVTKNIYIKLIKLIDINNGKIDIASYLRFWPLVTLIYNLLNV